jgi:hypothetical protein
MRKNRIILPLILATLVAATSGHAAERSHGGEQSRSGEQKRATTVHGILIIASNEPAKADPRLAAYEGILQRALNFRSFRFVAQSSTTVAAGAVATLDVQGHQAELQGKEDGSVYASSRGAGNTISPGGPGTVFVAGSAGSNGEMYGLIVFAN